MKVLVSVGNKTADKDIRKYVGTDIDASEELLVDICIVLHHVVDANSFLLIVTTANSAGKASVATVLLTKPIVRTFIQLKIYNILNVKISTIRFGLP